MSAMANASESTPAPPGNLGAQRRQELWKRRGPRPIVRLAKKLGAPPRHDAAHFEVRKRQGRDAVEQGVHFDLGKESSDDTEKQTGDRPQ
jgi:hypothetical protein